MYSFTYDRGPHNESGIPPLLGRVMAFPGLPAESFGRNARRVFVAEYGESIGQFRVRIRLEYAAGLLTLTDELIKCIANDVGYATAEAFATAFRNRFGQAPSEFRARNGELIRLMPGFLITRDVPLAGTPSEVGLVSPNGALTTYTYRGIACSGVVFPALPTAVGSCSRH